MIEDDGGDVGDVSGVYCQGDAGPRLRIRSQQHRPKHRSQIQRRHFVHVRIAAHNLKKNWFQFDDGDVRWE